MKVSRTRPDQSRSQLTKLNLSVGKLHTISTHRPRTTRLRSSCRFGISLTDSLQGLASARDLPAALPDAGEPLPPHILAPCRDARVRTALLEFIEAAENAFRTREALAGATSSNNAAPLLREDVGELLAQTAASLTTRGLEGFDCSQLRQRLEQGRTAEKRLSAAEDCFVALTNLLGCHIPFDTRSVDLVLNCLLAVERAPLEVLHLRTPKLESDGAGQILEAASAKARELREQHRNLDDSFNVSTLTDATDGVRLGEAG